MESRVALVTGASSGIGLEAAKELRRNGFTVYAVARRVEPMAQLEHDGVVAFSMDVTDDASMVAGVDRVLAEQGRIDVLVSNAGYGSFGALEDVPLHEARHQFEVNVFGLARLVQLVLPTMREQASGRIINVSSIGGKIYAPLGGWYHATKFAVEGLSDSLRLELAPFGIDVVLIEPGPIITGWNTIARTNLVERSAHGPYAAQAASVGRTLASADRPGRGSRPDVVGRRIARAATAAHPRPRYPAGRGAGTAVRARRMLPDRVFDRVIARVYGLS